MPIVDGMMREVLIDWLKTRDSDTDALRHGTLTMIGEIEADRDMAAKERDMYKGLLSKMMGAIVEFSDAFGPVIPEESKTNWNEWVAQIKAFSSQLGC